MSTTPSTAELERLLALARTARLERSAPKPAPIERAGREGRIPLSFAQQRLWFLEQLGGVGSTYNIRKPRRLRGELDRAALVRALDGIVARHETLRTVFAQVDGEPEQRIAPAETSRFALVEHDLEGREDAREELGRLMAEEAGAPFDLERGPLIRGRLIRLAADDHLLLVTMHHIVSDAWSSEVFAGDFSALYAAYREGREPELPALPVQYADYAVWQRRWLEGEVLQQQAAYWTRTLAGAPERLELPADFPRPARMDHAGGRVDVLLDEALSARLRALGQRHGTTPFMTLLAGWAVVLARLSGQNDLVIGTPTANRGRREIEGLIGFFVNTLALRVDLSGSPTVAELLGRVRRRVLDAQQHQDIPFEQVVERVDPPRSLAHTPLFQVLFAWLSTPRTGGLSLPGLESGGAGAAGGVAAPVQEQFDLSLALREMGDRIGGSVTYATSLFARETVERWVGYLRRVLEEMVADEGQRVDRLALIPADERSRTLDAWNRTEASYPADSCIHDLFARTVERAPDAAAVVFAGGSVAYAELDARANRLAHHLRSLGVGPDVRVAVCAERGPEMVTGLLAVLKAGGAYVPLDPTHPEDRLRYVLADSRPAAVLTSGALPRSAPLADLFREAGVPVLALDADAARWASLPDTAPSVPGLTPDHLAYTIYTSGSTGRPKGVMNHHRGVVNLLRSLGRTVAAGEGDRFLAVTTLSFDIAALEIFLPLVTGGELHLLPDAAGADPAMLAHAMDAARITLVQGTPATWRLLVDSGWRGREGLRALSGGEALPAELAARVSERVARLWNVYGPTETTIWSTAEEVAPGAPGAAGPVSIGAPLANTRVYVLDAAGEPSPVGVAGELYIAGDGVARGYRGRPALTAERFVADPFSATPGARAYRTGDLARWRPDGRLEFLGRTDFQVKVRGFRIEPGEIEARLAEHPGVREAVVTAQEYAPGERRLVAYVVADEAAGADVLRAHLGETLPGYMVPAVYVRLSALPLTPNGKVDRRALPAPEGDAYAFRGYEEPAGETERALAEIWAEVLGVERVGRRDNFFELGGHSLLVVRVIARMRRSGLHAEVRSLFTAPVLADLAAQVGGESREADVPPNAIPGGCARITPEMLPLVALEQAEIDAVVAGVPGGAPNVQDIYPLAPLQEGILFHHLMTREGDPYLLASTLRFAERSGLDRYLDALQAIIDRHDILRTGVVWEGLREPVQVVWRRAPLRVEEVETEAADVEAELGARFDPRHYRIDVRQAPLVRACVARDGDGWLLLLLRHHLVSDHETLGVLRAEIEAHLAGRGDALPAPPPFRNFVAQARLGVSPEEHAAFFREMLGEVDEPTAPFGLLDARGDGSGLDEARLRVETGLAARVRERARALGVSAASLFHVAWAQVLAMASGRDDVVFGTLLFGRMQGGEGAERVMGPFINTLPVRIAVGNVGAETGVRATHALLAGVLRHEHASLALAQRCSGVQAPAPLFTSLLNYRHSARRTAPGAGDARASADGARRVHERTNYPLALSVDDLGSGFALTVQAQASVGPARVCAMMHTALESLARALERAPGAALGGLEVLPDEERRRVVEAWNDTDAAYPRDVCTHELFQAQAERTPDAAAVLFAGRTLTYAELNARANRLAHHLRAGGVGPDARVAVCMERSADMVVALLAVLKAGGAYVPLDPEYPVDRLRYMLGDSTPVVLLAHAATAGLLDGAGVPVLDVARDERWAAHPAENPERGGLTGDHLAYLIYTSGSTGLPKGVMVQHSGLTNYVWYARLRYMGGEPLSFPLYSSIGFDLTVTSIYPPLVAGGAISVHGAEGPGDLPIMRVLDDGSADAIKLTPAHLSLLEAGERGGPGAARMARLVVGGEELKTAVARAALAAFPGGVELLNEYGPTEAVVGCMIHRYDVLGDLDPSVPIGRAIDNTRVYVLNARGLPVPTGVAGELYVGGVQVTRGYLGRARLTAERFVPDPFGGAPGARLYRTGDMARWRADGVMEYLGRNDGQVKLRGFRIELGEIEARLAEHPEVREAVVAAREDGGEKRLVAYCVGTGGAAEAESLRGFLGERLPGYMVPAAYVWMDHLPLTPNGKVDRRALPAPGADAYGAAEFQEPEGVTEHALAEIWADVLRVERVGRGDDFFDLGGHSLLAVQVISRVRQVLGAEVPLSEVFVHPALADFARQVETAGRAALPAIEPAPRGDRVPLSFAQQRLWFLERMGNLGSTYHVRKRLRMRGALDRAALARALGRVVQRHEALRTVFAEVDGVPEQRIAPAVDGAFPLAEHDLAGRADARAELGRIAAEDARLPFDLERGPLVRGALVRLGADDHVLLLAMHHIVSDGWSMEVLTRELGALYEAFRRGEPDPLPALPVQYADYAAWQRRWVEGELLGTQAEYWARTLAGAPELLELPADRPRPARMDHAGAQLGIVLDEELTAGLRALSRRHGTTLFMTLLAGWAVVLGRLAGRDDVVVGTPTAGRGRGEIEGLIGFFVNTLAVRVNLSGSPTVAELLARVKQRALDAQHHQDIPFEQIVELVDPARSLSHAPLFQVTFAWQNTPGAGDPPLPGMEPAAGGAGPRGETAEEAPGQAKFDLGLSLSERGGRIGGSLTYATSLFDRATVERWAGHLRRVLEEMAADPGRPVERLSLMGAEERARVVEEWNRTELEYPAGSCVHALFEAQAARTPGAEALVWEDRSLTYAELNARANRLAHHLRSLGVGPDVRVGICVDRGPEMVVALLALLKAGGAYVALDPEHPEERLRWVLEDSRPAVLLADGALAGRFAGMDVPVIAVDADAARWADLPDTDPRGVGAGPDHLVYVIYTSGSTGRPKGVMNTHRNVVNRIAGIEARWKLDAGESVLQNASLSFDVSAYEIFWPLMRGARVVLTRPDGHRDPAYLVETIRRHAIGTASFVPSMLRLFLEEPGVEACTSLVRVPCGGEALPPALVRRFHERLPRATLYNRYGPSEAATAVTGPVDAGEGADAGVPIGRPMPNARAYVLDRVGAPVPVGVPGELCIGGDGVGRGYLDRPALTAERFVPDPFSGEAGARMYRTGDRARWRAEGTIEFLGRTDFQLKVRGFRIEPGEVEARLREHPAIREAVVVARGDASGDRLVAYCVADGDVDAEGVRAHLGRSLPDYMVPAAYVTLDRLPLTPNGKLDREALPAPPDEAYARGGYEAPADETEEVIAGIWAELLGMERVGRRDSFFELGGHSLLAVQVISRVRQMLDVEVALGTLFTHPVLAEFAQEVVDTQLAQVDPAEMARLLEMMREPGG